MPMRSSRLRGSSGHESRSLLAWVLSAFGVLGLIIALAVAADRHATRIVAIGDIHGRWDRLVSIMQQADLLDEKYAWSGGDSTFVVMGDFMDRGPNVREVMDLLMRLQNEAPKQDGEVVVLLGNHEMMNIIGDYRYVTLEIFASFADKDSEERRREAYERYRGTLALQARTLGVPPADEVGEEEWMRSHPPGFLEYVEALGPKESYGKWLRHLPVVVKIGDTVFVHGGIHPGIRSYSIKDLNRRIEKEHRAYDDWRDSLIRRRILEPFYTLHESLVSVRAYRDYYVKGGSAWDTVGQTVTSSDRLVRVLESFLNIGDWLSTHADGPLWFRGFAKWSDEEGDRWIGPLLETYGARRFVVGHTVLGEGITRRFDDRVLLIDTEKPSALEITGERLREIYVDDPTAGSEEGMAEQPAYP